MAEAPNEVAAYEAWLRTYVKHAETGRKLASHLADDARRRGARMNQHRFSSHAQRLYNEEVYWTLQIDGVAKLALEQRVAAPLAEPAPVKRRAKAPASRPRPRA
jgi:hypothetical protein